MSVCRDCIFWKYNFPHVAGVCTIGPQLLLGQCAPMTVDLVGNQLAHEFDECTTATWHSSTCLLWEPLEDLAKDIPFMENGKEHSWLEDEDE